MLHRQSRRRDQSEQSRQPSRLLNPLSYHRPGQYDLSNLSFKDYLQRKPPQFDIIITVLRHGERVDLVYGSNWFEQLLYDTKRDRYNYNHPNLPRNLPKRREAFRYLLDPPITRNGEDQARSFGYYIKPYVKSVDYCYASSPCRCVLTANAVLEGMNKSSVPIRVEPYLFEPMNWNSALYMYPSISSGLARSDWINANYNISRSYHRLGVSIDPNETEIGFYNRTRIFIKSILDQHEKRKLRSPNPNIVTSFLVVGHAGSPVVFEDILAGKGFDLRSFESRVDDINYLDTYLFRRRTADQRWFKDAIPSPFNKNLKKQ